MSLIDLTGLSFPFIGFILGACGGASFSTSHVRNDAGGFFVGGGLGGIAGGFAGIAAHFLLWFGFLALIHFAEWWRPSYPTCLQGRCGSDDYNHLWPSSDLPDAERLLASRVVQDGIGLLVRCHCGDRYVSSRKYRRLLEVGPDDTLRPYRYHKPFGRRWLPDSNGLSDR